MIDPAFYSLSIVILRPGDLGLHFVQSTEVEVVSEGCLLVKVTAPYHFNSYRATGHSAVRYRLGLPITRLFGWLGSCHVLVKGDLFGQLLTPSPGNS